MRGVRPGIDIVSIERIRKACRSKTVLERLFTENELACAFSRRDPFKCLAGRFAAKEAFLKALGTGLSKGIRWKDVEVLNKKQGSPFIRTHGAAKGFVEDKKVFLSISYASGFSVAFAALE